MRDFFTSSLAVLVTVILIGSILATAIPLQQQASAFEKSKKLTHEKRILNMLKITCNLKANEEAGGKR